MRLEIINGPAAPMRRLEPSVGAHVLTGVHDAAKRDAEAILDSARRDAQRIVSHARIEADRIAEDARQSADRDGARRWNESALALSRARDEAIETVEREALALAVEIARRIVRTHLTTSAEGWADLIASSTERMRRDATLVVRYSTCDAERLEPVRERLSSFERVVFEPDDALGQGDCIAECAGVRVDARLDVQISAIERLLCAAGESEESA